MNPANTLKAFRLWLEPDKEIPKFQRLAWRVIDVPVADVLLHGIHPWSGADSQHSLPDIVVHLLNDDLSKVSVLVPFNLCGNVSVPNKYTCSYTAEKLTTFERTLEMIRKEIVFVENLAYGEVLDIARTRLRSQWCHEIAKRLLANAHPGFQEQRRFLKTKDKRLKLSSYEDLDQFDLAEVLTLEDFVQRDVLLVSEGIPTRNFRSASWLGSITDDQGRLRLIPDIRHVTLSVMTPSKFPQACGVHVSWQAERKGRTLHFRPHLGDSVERRNAAQEFAAHWRTDDGRLCFETTLERLAEMIESGAAKAEFPCLNYGKDHQEGHAAHAQVGFSHVQAYAVGRFPTSGCAAEDLREVLRSYGVSMTGAKDVLVEKLAELAAREYAKHLAKMDRFFRRQRFVRIEHTVTNAVCFSVLEGLAHIEHLLVTMYLVKHLRGGAVLDPNHENNTYIEQELARALLKRDVTLTGAFLRVS